MSEHTAFSETANTVNEADAVDMAGNAVLEEMNDMNTKNAVQSLIDDAGCEPVDEMKLYVFENMLELLKGVPGQFEAIAVARLALLGSVTGLVQQNSALISLVQMVCEKFEVTVKVTQINGTTVFEKDLPILANQKYDIKTLQMGMISLISKMNIIVSEGAEKTKQVAKATNDIDNLKEDVRRLTARVKELSSVPPPPEVEKPYRLSRSYVNKDGDTINRYIAKCDESGYKSTRMLSKALAWDNAEKALERLVHLNQNAQDYPIPHIFDFKLVSLHTVSSHTNKGSTELQLALAKARARAEKNLTGK